MKRQNNILLLKDVLRQCIREAGWEEKLQEARVLLLWDELLGPAVARATRQKYIASRKLFVRLNSSIVRQQLFMMRREIVETLNRQAGASVIDELILQ
jgi:predicted nucleic acid-binding Zn ribbon protein